MITFKSCAFIRLYLFVKIDLQKWLDKPFDDPPKKNETGIQGVLFPEMISIP